MRKLFELFLSFFRPVPKDVVNTGYCYLPNSCNVCGSSEDVAPEGTHPDADGLCWKCFAKSELDYEG
jgi:hypothetical protein